MARYLSYFNRFEKCLSLLNLRKARIFYPPSSVLCTANRIHLQNLHRFHTYVPLNCQEVNKKSENKTSIKKVNNIRSTEVEIALKKLQIAAQNGKIATALEIYTKWNQKSEFHETDIPFLTLVSSLLKAERLDEAKIIVAQFNENEVKSQSTNESDRILYSIFFSLGNQSTDEIEWFVNNLIFTRKYINQRVLQIVMDIYLKKDDLNTTLLLFIRFAENFRMTPLLLPLTCELIYKNDADGLEKLLQITSKVNGQVNSIFDMAMAFTSCGRIDQAKKIFESLDATAGAEKLEYFIENSKQRKQIKQLHNFLVATENFASIQLREIAYISLLELYLYKNDSKQNILDIFSAMDKENIVPDQKHIDKIKAIMRRKNIGIPTKWMTTSLDKGSPESMLQELLTENKLEEANKILYESFDTQKPLLRNVIKFCLMKNAENGNITIFKDLKPKFDSNTKAELNFVSYECKAYLNAQKYEEYLQQFNDEINNNPSDLKELAISLPSTVIRMIESDPNIYEKYVNLARIFASQDHIKPICLAWIYNFINNINSTENDEIWDLYLKPHPTITCNQVVKVLYQRKEIDKMRTFLNFDKLNKKFMFKPQLGKAYSTLFDGLFYKNDYDAIIDELEKALNFVSLSDFKSNTLSRIKLGPEELSQRFWTVVNKRK